MKAFRDLYLHLDRTQSTNEKVEWLVDYFSKATPEDAAWAYFFLSGERLKRTVGTAELKRWFKEWQQFPEWLFDECYASVGDTAETLTLLIPLNLNQKEPEFSLAQLLEETILPLANLEEKEKKERVIRLWQSLDRESCYIFNKLLTGSFRVGASKQLTTRALAETLKIPQEKLSHALLGITVPSKEFFNQLKQADAEQSHSLHPFPFYLATPLETSLEELGSATDWIAEWKWDGIRAQAVIQESRVLIWSRGNEIITHQCPELVEAFSKVNQPLVLDGEILAYQDKPLSFFALQKRLGRKKPSKKIQEEVPLAFMAYDLLSLNGQDLRSQPLEQRRKELEVLITLINEPRVLISSQLEFKQWQELATWYNRSKDFNVEGLMIKLKSSTYKSGRVRGEWWKYKVEPMTIDAVLMYAQPGNGRRANLYTDYTFGLWDKGELVPIAKAYSGLDQKEINELDKWIRRHTIEKFGPVRRVEPFYVFEIAFESIQLSNRHKAGVAVRFPRILRWRKDKPADQANQLADLKEMLGEAH